MGVFNSGLLRAAAQAIQGGVKGDREGKAAARKQQVAEDDRRRQIEEDALRQSILGFNFEQAQTTRAAQGAQATANAKRIARLRTVNPQYADLSPDSLEKIVVEQAKPKEAKAVPGSAEDLKILTAQATARAAGAPDRPQSAAEVAAQDQMPIVKESYDALEELETKDPHIGNKVIAKANKARQFSVGRVIGGVIGKVSGTRSEDDQKALTEQTIINSLTPDEARWYAASKGYLSGVLPALGGKTLTINEIISHGSPMFPTGEESDESLAQKRRARAARYQATQNRAGVKGEVPKRKEPSAAARALVGRVK